MDTVTNNPPYKRHSNFINNHRRSKRQKRYPFTPGDKIARQTTPSSLANTISHSDKTDVQTLNNRKKKRPRIQEASRQQEASRKSEAASKTHMEVASNSRSRQLGEASRKSEAASKTRMQVASDSRSRQLGEASRKSEVASKNLMEQVSSSSGSSKGSRNYVIPKTYRTGYRSQQEASSNYRIPEAPNSGYEPNSLSHNLENSYEVSATNNSPSANKLYKKKYGYLLSATSFYEDLLLNNMYSDDIINITNNSHYRSSKSRSNFSKSHKGGENSRLSGSQKLHSLDKKSITNALNKQLFNDLLNFADNCHDFCSSRGKDLKDIKQNYSSNKEWIQSYHESKITNQNINRNSNIKEYYNIINEGGTGFEATFLLKLIYDKVHEASHIRESLIYFNKTDKDIYKNIANKIREYYPKSNNNNLYYIYDMSTSIDEKNMQKALTEKEIKRADCFAKLWDPASCFKINADGKSIDKIIGNDINKKIYQSELSLSNNYIQINKSSDKNNEIKLTFINNNSPPIELLLKKGFSVKALSLIARKLYYKLNEKNDSKASEVSLKDSSLYLYDKFLAFIENNTFKDLSPDKKFELLFKIILDMKRTGDHGLVKTVKLVNESSVNANNSITKAFLLTEDSLCATKAYLEGVPCLFSSYDFEKDKNTFKELTKKTIQNIKHSSSMSFYTITKFDIKPSIIPIFIKFNDIQLDMFESNKHYQNIIFFCLKYFNSNSILNISHNTSNNEEEKLKFIDIFKKYINQNLNEKIKDTEYKTFEENIGEKNYIYLSLLDLLDTIFKLKFFNDHYTNKIINFNKTNIAYKKIIKDVKDLNQSKKDLQNQINTKLQFIKDKNPSDRKVTMVIKEIKKNQEELENISLKINSCKQKISTNAKDYIKKEIHEKLNKNIFESLSNCNLEQYIEIIQKYINDKFSDYTKIINEQRILKDFNKIIINN